MLMAEWHAITGVLNDIKHQIELPKLAKERVDMVKAMDAYVSGCGYILRHRLAISVALI